MAGQGIWSGTISFSLVAIPVRLVRAVAPQRIAFRLLHSTDHSPLARRMFCPEDEAMVSPEEIVRGYELAPDHYLPVTDEELESVSPERSRTIEILEFIDLDEVDPVYFDRPYYLVPLKGGEKSYRLLAEVMRQTNKAGLAKFVLSEREYLVAVTSREGALVLVTLHYHDEVLPEAELAPEEAKISGAAKTRLKARIKKMMVDFDPEKYADARREKVLDLLKRKAREEAPVEAPGAEEEEGAGPPDLMAALEEAMRDVKKNR
ncbi:MAG: Ku protein [Proteobacteria bacterium]|nr:Ku protein [Pseudomonadota bacterium]